jgi:hypothetical protein
MTDAERNHAAPGVVDSIDAQPAVTALSSEGGWSADRRPSASHGAGVLSPAVRSIGRRPRSKTRGGGHTDRRTWPSSEDLHERGLPSDVLASAFH